MKRIWTILITVVATAAIVGGGTWYLIDSHAEKDKDKLQTELDTLNQRIADEAAISGATVTSGTTATTGTTVADPMAGWKSVSLSKLNLSMKYPETWGEATLDAGETSSPDVHIQIYHFSLNKNYSINYETAASSGVGGNILGQFYNTTANEVAVKVSVNNKVVGGIIEHKKDMDVCDGVGCSEKDIVYGVYFKTGTMYSNIVFESLPDTTANRTVLENMIKSISPVDVTADWKTYTDSNRKLSFEYPADWTITQGSAETTIASPDYSSIGPKGAKVHIAFNQNDTWENNLSMSNFGPGCSSITGDERDTTVGGQRAWYIMGHNTPNSIGDMCDPASTSTVSWGRSGIVTSTGLGLMIDFQGEDKTKLSIFEQFLSHIQFTK